MKRATTAWELANGGIEPVKLGDGAIQLEKHLEDWIERKPDLLEPNLAILARQLDTGGSGFLDLLCLDQTGRLVVVELKRGEAYRDALAQVLDYVARIVAMPSEHLVRIVDENRRGHGWKDTLADVLASHLGDRATEWTPEGTEPRILIAGRGGDESLRGIVEFLGRYDVPVNGVFFDVYTTQAGNRLLVRSSVANDEKAAAQGKRPGAFMKNEDLLTYAESLGSRSLVEPVIEAWSAATGKPPLALRGMKIWKLQSTSNGLRAAARVWPYDYEDPTKKAWFEISCPDIADDLSMSEEAVREGIEKRGLRIEVQREKSGDRHEWIDLSTPEKSAAVVNWINSAYAGGGSAGG